MMASEPVPVLCLPYAGGGASFFRAWQRLADPAIEIHPVQLPGREERIDDEPYVDVRSAVDGLGAELLDLVAGQRIALFGHSLGAVLAYELARWLAAAGIHVTHLFISGSPAPRLGRDQRATGLDDEEFLRRVVEFAGYRHPAFEVPELRELILPLLRADVALHEDYQPLSEQPVDVPITCFRGADDELVSLAQCQAWRSATTAGFELIELDGGHMFLVDSADALLTAVAERLDAGVLESR